MASHYTRHGMKMDGGHLKLTSLHIIRCVTEDCKRDARKRGFRYATTRELPILRREAKEAGIPVTEEES
jgi:hypothetical protein